MQNVYTPNADSPEKSEFVLPQINAPQEAIAETHQRKGVIGLSSPRGVAVRFLSSTPTTLLTPHSQSAFWFQELYDGYMAAQSVSYAAFASDTLKMLSSENEELKLAYKDASMSIDESLPARRCSIWLLANYGDVCSTIIDNTLDALSAWASFKPNGNDCVINKIRMNAVFGPDADFVLNSLQSEIIGNSDSRVERQQILLALRWFDGTKFQTAIRDVSNSHGLVHIHNAVKCVQDTIVRLSGTYDAPIPSICMRAVPYEMATSQCFYKNLHNVSNEFFNMTSGEQSITFSEYTKQKNASRILQPTGCLVRVMNKNLGKAGICHPTCFHGAIIGLANKKAEIREFINSSNESGIRIPEFNGKFDEAQLGLHLCAVQAEGFQLKSRISLFGISGVAGKPIHSPGSWIWVARPAVRPIEAALLQVFELHPCEMTCILPGKQELVPAFERFWTRTSDMFKLIASGDTECNHNRPTNDRPYSPVLVRELMLRNQSDEDFATLSMMRVDPRSERTTIGDAYACLSWVPGAESIAQNMKEAMASIGVRASMYELWKHNSQAASHFRTCDESKRKSDQCLMELCEIALDMACANKRFKTELKQQPLCLPPDRIRRISKACGLKGGEYMTISKGSTFLEDQLRASLNIVMMSIGFTNMESVDSKIKHLIKKTLTKLCNGNGNLGPQEWSSMVFKTFAMAAAFAAVAFASVESTTFFIIGTMQENEVFIKQVVLNGSLEPSSVDSMCLASMPRAIILQEVEYNKIRVTSTVRTS